MLHPSGVTGGGGQRVLTGKFLLLYQEKRGKEKRENGAEKKENQKREGEQFRMEKLQNEERTFFLFFLKTTEICFGSTEMGIFLPG